VREIPADELLLREYTPRPRLVVKQTPILRPRFSVFDAHNHLGPTFGGDWGSRSPEELLALLDEAGVEAMVDLDGGWGDTLAQRIEQFQRPYPDRFLIFAQLDWNRWAFDPEFPHYAVESLRHSAALGARGLKVWKTLGLRIRDASGQLVPVDDERLDSLWATAGELGLPVLIHVADPVAFFDPLDRFNERWEELREHPDWHFYGPAFPSFETIMRQFANLVRRHPHTTFIGAHVGCYAENLAWVSELLNACPNLYVDIAARLAELGRQPYTARRFLIQHQDRVLFGVDEPVNPAVYRIYYRFLETDDEYFPYGIEEVPRQGRWCIYGVYLPDDVLRKIYHENARRLFGKSGGA
jgi:predicted TIM-barrel fold metal-dependent hydrolase